MRIMRILVFIVLVLITIQLDSFSKTSFGQQQQFSKVNQQADNPFASTEFDVVDVKNLDDEKKQLTEKIQNLNSVINNIKKEKLWYKSSSQNVAIPSGFSDEGAFGRHFFDCFNYIDGYKLNLSKTPKALENFEKRERDWANAKSNFKVQWADSEKKKVKYAYYWMKEVVSERTSWQEERHYLMVYGEDQKLKEVLITNKSSSTLITMEYNNRNKIHLVQITTSYNKNNINSYSYVVKKGT